MSGLKNKVQESSVALQNYRVKSGIMGLQEQRQITAQKIMDFNKAYLESQAQRLSVEAKMNELARIAGDRGGIQTIFTVADNALIQKLKQEAADLDVQKSKLLKTYKDKHPRSSRSRRRSTRWPSGSKARSRPCCEPCRRSTAWPGRARRRCSATSTSCARKARS